MERNALGQTSKHSQRVNSATHFIKEEMVQMGARYRSPPLEWDTELRRDQLNQTSECSIVQSGKQSAVKISQHLAVDAAFEEESRIPALTCLKRLPGLDPALSG